MRTDGDDFLDPYDTLLLKVMESAGCFDSAEITLARCNVILHYWKRDAIGNAKMVSSGSLALLGRQKYSLRMTTTVWRVSFFSSLYIHIPPLFVLLILLTFDVIN